MIAMRFIDWSLSVNAACSLQCGSLKGCSGWITWSAYAYKNCSDKLLLGLDGMQKSLK